MHWKCNLFAVFPYLLSICNMPKVGWVIPCEFCSKFTSFPAVQKFWKSVKRFDKLTESLKVGTFFETQCRSTPAIIAVWQPLFSVILSQCIYLSIYVFLHNFRRCRPTGNCCDAWRSTSTNSVRPASLRMNVIYFQVHSPGVTNVSLRDNLLHAANIYRRHQSAYDM